MKYILITLCVAVASLAAVVSRQQSTLNQLTATQPSHGQEPAPLTVTEIPPDASLVQDLDRHIAQAKAKVASGVSPISDLRLLQTYKAYLLYRSTGAGLENYEKLHMELRPLVQAQYSAGAAKVEQLLLCQLLDPRSATPIHSHN